ncbi:unnamed protein product [Dracunculus medinensis]|uniref:Charged multivesicular body protein 6 n=1 Tax=Dracunculus medinensis TaxID=318479 RepID=A0A0N4UP64_DRAME|nr:unnamed protein product [Dracunculus medinensis]
MGNIFGRHRASKVPEVSQHDLAVLQLKTQRDRMKQYVRRNEKQMEREKEIAKKLIKMGKKDRALLLLKKKRYQENIIERTLKQLDQIDMMVNDLEFAAIEKRVVDELRKGKEALEQINKMFSLDDIEKILEQTAEAAEYQEEISNLLSGKLSETDLEGVENELQLLLESEKFVLPEVPTNDLPIKESKREHVRVERQQKIAVEAD